MRTLIASNGKTIVGTMTLTLSDFKLGDRVWMPDGVQGNVILVGRKFLTVRRLDGTKWPVKIRPEEILAIVAP